MNQLTKEQQRLVAEHVDYAQGLSKPFCLGMCADLQNEIKQESCMGLIDAALEYDPRSSVEFKYFAYIRCICRIHKALYEWGVPIRVTKTERQMVEMIRLDAMFDNDDEDNGSELDQVLYMMAKNSDNEEPETDPDDEEKRALIDKAMAQLTLHESNVLKWSFGYKCKSLSGEVIAKKLGISISQVSRIKERALLKVGMALQYN